MEKETHHLKIIMNKGESMKVWNKQHNKYECEKCDFAANPKTDRSNNIEAYLQYQTNLWFWGAFENHSFYRITMLLH